MNLYLATAWLLFGCLTHFLVVLAALEDAGTNITPAEYLRSHPYRAASMVACAFILMLCANAAHQLTELAAVLIGFSCQAAADSLRARASAQVNLTKETPNVP